MRLFVVCSLMLVAVAPNRAAALPTGYFVWVKGTAGVAASRAIFRVTLPGKTDEMQLTETESVEPRISPNGKWVAYAKAKLPGGSDYHDFNFWRLYVVSIHGTGDGREENLIDDNGYWPSWGNDGKLYYSQVDDNHTLIMRATLDEYGRLVRRDQVLSTRDAFSNIPEINECFMSPDATWFAARVRQIPVPGVGAFTVSAPEYSHLAAAGAKGCMPIVAPSGKWALIAGSGYGIRWGDSPLVGNRKTDQELISPHGSDGLVYHPGISNDEQWVMAAHSTDLNHNDGNYDIYIYELNGRSVRNEELLMGGQFNGWPDLWVGEPSDPPPPIPGIDLFVPNSYTIVPPDGALLSWHTSFATDVSLDNAAQCQYGAVLCDETTLLCGSGGPVAFSPTATTTYTLTAENCHNLSVVAAAHVVVTVNATPQAVVINRLTLDPEEIVAGDSAQLSWSVTNPTTLEINGVGVAPIGSLRVDPLESTTYTLTALGHQGPVTVEVTLEVTDLEAIPPALLDDRGGCMCDARHGNLGWILFGLCLMVWRRRCKPAARQLDATLT